MPPPRDVLPFLYTLMYRLNVMQGVDASRAGMHGAGFVGFLLAIVMMMMIALIDKILAVDLFGLLLVPMILAAVALLVISDHILVKRGVGVRFEKRFDRVGTADRIWLSCYAVLLLGFIVGGFALGGPAEPRSALKVVMPASSRPVD